MKFSSLETKALSNRKLQMGENKIEELRNIRKEITIGTEEILKYHNWQLCIILLK